MTPMPGLPTRLSLALICLLAGATPAGAQSALPVDSVPDTIPTTARYVDGDLLRNLPVDRLEDELLTETGIIESQEGRLLFRGGQDAFAGRYLDGIPVTPGLRHSVFPGILAPSAFSGELIPGVIGLGGAVVYLGPLGSSYGNALTGILATRTLFSGGPLRGKVSYETDEIFGAQALGTNRLNASIAGSLSDRIQVHGAAVLHGQSAMDIGKGARTAPIFVAAGIDTAVVFAKDPFDPFSDTLRVDITQFAIGRGDCDLFNGSTNPDIAGNSGEDCQGIRTPASAVSSYTASGGLEYRPGNVTSIRLLGMATQRQARLFDYNLLYNPQALLANRSLSRLIGLQVTHELDRSSGLRLDAGLSWQSDRVIEGPLTAAGEQDTRSPAGGFMVGGLDFQHDFETFPINDELLENYLVNTPGTRRSPYDLENRDQYSLLDEYRNNAYGILGFAESGGPLGRITMAQESRIVGQGAVAWAPVPEHNLRIGAEFTRYDVDYYSHKLTSQAGSDVWLESPVYSAIYVEDRFSSGRFMVVAGVRYDRFDSRASRPEFPRISTAPGFDPSNPTVGFLEDESHSSLAPRVLVAWSFNDITTLRAGYARQSAVPDFGLLFRGINSDLSIVSTGDAFATDLELAKADMFEIGVRRRISNGLMLDLSLWNRQASDLPIHRLVTSFDPVVGANLDLVRIVSQGERTVRGLDLRLDGRPLPWLGLGVGYSLQQARHGSDIPTPDSRPHTVAGIIALSAPEGLDGTLEDIFRGTTLHALFRFSSGTPYTRCPDDQANASVLSSQLCNGIFDADIKARLPAVKQLDLRLAREFTVGGRAVTAYLDFRNLFNFTNVRQVFSATGTTTSPILENFSWSSDSSAFALEAEQNGLYDSMTGNMDLRFGGAAASGCASWLRTSGQPAVPNCVYLVRAEERFGDGDHIFTLSEQRRASKAHLDTQVGEQLLTGPGRRLRLGFEVGI